MTTFALITEGITDQAILENILHGLTNGTAITHAISPQRDATDNSRVALGTFSNWELVLEHVSSNTMLEALQTSDFIVVQMDTDQCEHQNFNVPLAANGHLKTITQLVSDCTNKIKSLLPPNFPISELHRLLFALPILSSECWLIGLFKNQYIHTEKTANKCEVRLANILHKKNNSLQKDYDTYLQLSKQFRKKKTLATIANSVPCLQVFVSTVTSQLPAV